MDSYYASAGSMYRNFSNFGLQATSASSDSSLEVRLMQMYSQFPVASPSQTQSLQWSSTALPKETHSDLYKSRTNREFAIEHTELLNPLDLSTKKEPAHALKLPTSAFRLLQGSSEQGRSQLVNCTQTAHSQVEPVPSNHHNQPSSITPQDQGGRSMSVISAYNPPLSYHYPGAVQLPWYTEYCYGRREGFMQQHSLTFGGNYHTVYPSEVHGLSLQGAQQNICNHSIGNRPPTFEQSHTPFQTNQTARNGMYGVTEVDPNTSIASLRHRATSSISQEFSTPVPPPYTRPIALAYPTAMTPFCTGYYPSVYSPWVVTPQGSQPPNPTYEVSSRNNSNVPNTATNNNQTDLVETSTLANESRDNKSSFPSADTFALQESVNSKSLPSEPIGFSQEVANDNSASVEITGRPDDSGSKGIENNSESVRLIRSPLGSVAGGNQGNRENGPDTLKSTSVKVIRKRVHNSDRSKVEIKNRKKSSRSSSKKCVDSDDGHKLGVKTKRSKLDSKTVTTKSFTNISVDSLESQSSSDVGSKTSASASCRQMKTKVGSSKPKMATKSSWSGRLRVRKPDDRSSSSNSYKKKLRSSVGPETRGNLSSGQSSTELKDAIIKREKNVKNNSGRVDSKGFIAEHRSKKFPNEKKFSFEPVKEVKLLPENVSLGTLKPQSDSSHAFDTIQHVDPISSVPSSTADLEGDDKIVDESMTKSEIISVIKSWKLNKQDGETILHRAAGLGNVDVTSYCLKKGLISSANCVNNAGFSPLHEACLHGHLRVAETLLSCGAGPSKSAPDGIRPLHLASKNGHKSLVRLLLSFGVDPWVMTDSGYTAWDMAEPYPEIRSLFQQNVGENSNN